MIDQETYKLLKEKYGEYASWAIWEDSFEGKPSSNVESLKPFEDPLICDKLNTQYIFVGLNAAGRPENNDSSMPDWGNFHGTQNKSDGDSKKNMRQKDYKLRYALKGSEYWGSYITDAIKGLKETNSKNVMEKIRNNDDYIIENAKKLKEELDIIGGNPVLIVFGYNAKRVIDKMMKYLPEGLNVVQVRHYSMRCGMEKYRDYLNEDLKKTKAGMPGLLKNDTIMNELLER